VETVLQDIRFALRMVRRSPGFVVAAIVTLALGIGANTAIFSVVSGVLLSPLPFLHPDRLMQLNEVDARNGSGAVVYRDLVQWRKQSTSFESMAAYANMSRNLTGVGEPERLAAVWSERGLFRLLGVEPIAGRTFRDDDPPGVVVLSAGLWKRRFGGDPGWIGRKITLDREPYTVIGVMPEEFQFPYRAARTDVWIPWDVPVQYAGSAGYRVNSVVARLKNGVTIDAAGSDLRVIAKRLEMQYPETNRGRSARITPFSEVVVGSIRPALLTLLGAVGLVLLIACANVTNLLLARGAQRTHEIAVRTALGASKGRLIRQLLTESILLSVAGSLVGLALAIEGTNLILRLASQQIPRYWEIGLDWRVFAFLIVVSQAAAIGFGLVPALAASHVNVQAGLKEERGSRSTGAGWSFRRLRDGLIIAEIALGFMLLASAGVLLRTFLRLQDTPAGLVAENVLTLQLTISLRNYSAPGSYGRYVHELEDHLKQIPGVRSAGFIQYLPLQNSGWTGFFSIPGRPPGTDAEQPRAELRYVSPGYFRALGIPLRRGRLLGDQDTSDATRVILINEALARKYFLNQDPVGQRTDRGTIVGVVGDVRQSRLDRPAAPEIYYAFAQNTGATSDAGVALVVSTEMRPEAIVSAVRRVIHQVNPEQAIFSVKTMQRVIAESLGDVSLYLWLVGVFAGLAVALAVAGVYGVISYAVTVRTQEFGIRMALGARRAQILRLVAGHGSVLIALGLALGVPGTLAIARVLKSLLSSAGSVDAATLAAVGVLLAAVALAACLVPARRATQVDPNVALRCE